jgi:hypothetical protein
MKYKIIAKDRNKNNFLVMVSKSLKDIKSKFKRLEQQGHKPKIIKES